MKKLQQEHMEAIGAMANVTALMRIIEVIQDWSDELPSEFDEFKYQFKQADFVFCKAIEAIADKYVE